MRLRPPLPVILSLLCIFFTVPTWAAVTIPAPYAVLMDVTTGQVLYTKNENTVTPPASLTKIMTMYLVFSALEQGHTTLDTPVHTSREASRMGGSQVYLSPNEVFPVSDLLAATVIASGNDAAYALAEHVAGVEPAFVAMMNRTAQRLGLTGTEFFNVHGLPPERHQRPTVSTAMDMAVLARALLVEYPEVLDYSSVWMQTFREKPLFILYNTNKMLRQYPGMDGLKTGYTSEAGHCLVATAERDNHRFIAVVMGAHTATDRETSVKRLLDYAYSGFEKHEVRPITVTIPDGKTTTLEITTKDLPYIWVPKMSEVEESIEHFVDNAPVQAGDHVATLRITVKGADVVVHHDVRLFATETVEQAPFLIRAWRRVTNGLGAN